MALNDRTRSQVVADASPLSTEQISEYASLNQSVDMSIYLSVYLLIYPSVFVYLYNVTVE